MSDYMSALDPSYAARTANEVARTGGAARAGGSAKSGGRNALNMDDFLQLLVAQFQNQGIDNNADTSDMLNQLVQMTTVQAITNITDSTVMMYAGSLVGKEVTIGQIGKDGKLEEIVGTVTGTGVVGGQQVIFVNGESYYLSDIMAVGRLPKIDKPDGGDGEKPGGGEKPEGGDGTTKPES